MGSRESKLSGKLGFPNPVFFDSDLNQEVVKKQEN